MVVLIAFNRPRQRDSSATTQTQTPATPAAGSTANNPANATTTAVSQTNSAPNSVAIAPQIHVPVVTTDAEPLQDEPTWCARRRDV